eukprot:c218_g1_i1.p1 GENE.c218_g1_i1~~c218_g1_i1.p1  ORF type:complete len:531 (+),score=133.48 c218_g1_i1:64-1593(+)
MSEHASSNLAARIFIDNVYLDASDKQTLPLISPHNAKVVGTIANATQQDVDAAVMSSRRAFDKLRKPGSGWDVGARVQALRNMSTQLSSRLEEFSVAESMDCGKPLPESRADIQTCADLFKFFADILEEETKTEAVPVPDPKFSCRLIKQPVGVVGCITPWNFPLLQAAVKVAPAIAAGCALVLKPSPLASATCSMLGSVARDAGVPPGILNVITGGPPGSNSGQFLIDHPQLDKLSFTGSGPTGMKCLNASAAHLRPTSLELGGKGAMIVFDDADVDSSLDWAMIGIFLCAGQVCSATSRVLVQRSVAKEFVDKLVERANKLRIGDPLSEQTQLGPVISADQHAKIKKHLEDAVAQGSRVLVGGPSADLNLAGDLADGFFIHPTVLMDVPTESRAWREEIFGPVLSVRIFDTEEEAIQLTNETQYGLGNSVMSRDKERLQRVSAALDSGVVWENCSQLLFPSTPFGGFKKSGFGKEMGRLGLEEYLAQKMVMSSEYGHSWNWYGFCGK